MITTRQLVLVLFVAVVPLWGQTNAQIDSPTENTESVPSQTPLLNQSSLAYSSELEHTNYVSGGVSLGATFDDNTLNRTADRLSNFTYSFLPFVELDHSRSRLAWQLDYAGGFVLNQHVAVDNQASHDVGLRASYRLSPHVTLALRDHFFRTTGFYDQVNLKFTPPSGGLLEQSNQFVITPLARQVGNAASAEVDYQFARDSRIGASGSFDLLHYRDVPLAANLIDTQSVRGEVFYNHRVFSQNWFGITYRYDKISFSPLPERALVNSLLLTDTVYLSPTMTLAVFAGPEQANERIWYPGGARVASGLVHSKPLSLAVGTGFNWNGRRTGVLVQTSRLVSDGGGALGAVRLLSAEAAVRHQWTRSISAQLGAAYGNNVPLSRANTPYLSLKMVSANFSLTRNLANALFITVGYSRAIQQEYQTAPGGPFEINHNRAWATLSYDFSRPWGR